MPLEAEENLELALSMQTGLWIAGFVRDDAGGPVAGAEVLAIDAGTGTSLTNYTGELRRVVALDGDPPVGGPARINLTKH